MVSPQPNSSRICERIHKRRQLVVGKTCSISATGHIHDATPSCQSIETHGFIAWINSGKSRIRTRDMEALYPSSEFSLKEVPRGHLSYRGLIGGGGATVSILFVCWMLYVFMNKYNFSMACSFSISRSRLRDIESPASDT
ncbi:hypothetical protein OIU84_023262 [Salix udensis]|uniref:Uncharacterized protein n=1 Tax=Salix udensis TaxID=889485 RepID=A0AAD6KSW4_9ROSI|nr:hypothetical protein OIU84_023262 [Salix udensis]